MSVGTMTEKKLARAGTVGPFGMEADGQRNGDLIVQGIGCTRLRSAIKPTVMVFDKEDGEQITRPASAGIIDGLPNGVPGMQLHVNPADLTWKVVDPLRDDEDMCAKIERAIRTQTHMSTGGKIRGVPTKSGKLDKDQMKTLVREMRSFVESGDAKVVRGAMPSVEDMDAMPGEYLTNPAGLSKWSQPRYEKDLDGWVCKLNTLG